MTGAKVAITGASGFLGWHTACRLRAMHGVEPVRIARADLMDPAALDDLLGDVDRILHLAGVNRADSDREVALGNELIGNALSGAIRRADRPISVAYSNSIQSELTNAYGLSKAAGAESVSEAVRATGGTFANVMLPNLFGEHGRPAYNSFVATFAHEVAHGRQPSVTGDRRVPLLHAQDAASAMIAALGADGDQRPEGEAHGVVEVLTELNEMHELYGTRGEFPDLTTKFRVNLFNTYRAASWPGAFPISPQVHGDERGELFETARAHGGTAQAFVSTTKPGKVRGDHYHLHKVERFFVVKGEAEIQLRRLLHDEVLTFRLSGDRPSFVDMPTLWVHNIRNVGDSELVTMFWADQLLDPAEPDQYPEKVQL